jgi:hypothetical protein
MDLFHIGRVCPGHPRTGGCTTSTVASPAGVGGRDTSGHEGESGARVAGCILMRMGRRHGAVPCGLTYRGLLAASICWIAAASSVTSAAFSSSANWSRLVALAIGAVTLGRAISHASAICTGRAL